jgi:hypothetical protein
MIMTYSFKVGDGDIPTQTELARYKRDSDRNIRGFWYRKYRHIKTIWNTITLLSPLIAVTLLTSHCIYV